MAINRHLLHVKSNQTNTVEVDGNDVVSAKLPRPADIEHGEIAINYHKDYETISIKNDNNEIVQFPNLGAVNTLISEAMSGAQDALTFDETPTANSTNPVTSEGIKSYVDAGDSIQSLTTYQSSTPLAVGDTHDQALSKLSKIIDDNEIITARALTDLNDTKQDEIDDLDEIRTGAALGATALQTETQLSKGTTTGNGNVVTDISVNNHQITLTKGATALTEHQSIKTVNGNTMVGTGNVSVGTITGITMNNVSKGTSGVVDLGTVITSETQLSKGTTTGDGNAVTDITVSNHQITLTKGSTFLVENDLANYADGAEYDSEEHLIYLKHGNTRLANPINAADFIKDGMVNSVRIDVLDDGSDSSDSSDDETRYLIVTFNTDAGLEDIEIPLSDIFDPSLYYTKEEIDEHELVTAAALTELHDTKADKIDYYTKDEVDELVDGNLDDYYTKQEVDEIVEEDELAISAALNDLNTNKQDVLDFDDEPTENSTNPVTSDGIKTYVDTVAEDIALVTSAALNELNDTIEDIENAIQSIQPELDFDDTPTAGSDNPVTSSGIKTYVDNASKITTLEEPAVSTPLAVNDTYDTAFGKLTKIIRDNEFTTAGALTELYETKQELLTFDNAPTENSENPVTSGAVYDALSNINTDHLTKVTYSELKTLRDDGELVPGMFYRITDYQCTTTQENTQSAGHQFDIVLLALSENKLAEEGWAMMHDNIYDVTFNDGVVKKCYAFNYLLDGEPYYNIVDCGTMLGLSSEGTDLEIDEDSKTISTIYDSTDLVVDGRTYNYFQNSNLSAWKVWYCLDNDTARFAWAQGPAQERITINEGGTILTLNRNTATDGQYVDSSNNQSFTGYGWVIDMSPDTIVITTSSTPSNGDHIFIGTSNSDSAQDSGLTVDSYSPATSGGNGVIYRLIDEFNNDVAYDFKNIQFKRKLTDGEYDTTNGTDTWCYTFNMWSDNLCQDASILTNLHLDNDAGGTYDNKIKGIIFGSNTYNDEPLKYVLNDICFLCLTSSFEGCFSNKFGENCGQNTFGNSCYCNTFENLCSGNVFGHRCFGNEFRSRCSSNTFGPECTQNVFGINCHSNTFGRQCVSNRFGCDCYSNTLGNWSSNNVIGNLFYSNTSTGTYFTKNLIGNECHNNTVGDYFGENIIGNNFYGNTIGNGFERNEIGNWVYSNTIGASFKFNTVGNNAYSNTMAYEFGYSTIGNGVTDVVIGSKSNDCFRYIYIGDGVKYLDLTTSLTLNTVHNDRVQNIRILGVSGSSYSSHTTITHPTINDVFQTTYQPANSQTVSI